ncbi:natural cytotoxicity triggering receptor 3 ligand 1 [Tenrec ecaudatus]|uniref:natural cytotoxicity triggering receptor 3 ligand 1 n=1 Tax=Tenrec ecaudatus TaxID=94439 RepID=UPI003F59C218
MAEGPADRWRWRFVGWTLLLLPCVLRPAGSLKVKMAGRTQIESLDANATLFCHITDGTKLDVRIMGIRWFLKRPGSSQEVKLFEYFGNNNKSTRPGAMVPLRRLKTGDASLQLPGLRLEDTGEYRCEVIVPPEKAQEQVFLEVVASPACSLWPETAKVRMNEEITLVCKANRFYPEFIAIAWRQWTKEAPGSVEISEDISTAPLSKNKDGTFSTTSSLKLKSSLEDSGSVYQCVVLHNSSTPLRFNSTLIVNKSEKTNLRINAVYVVILCYLIQLLL